MTNKEYQRAIDRLGWSQVAAGKIIGFDPRSSRRYASETESREIPLDLEMLLRVLVHSNLTRDDVGEPDGPLQILLRLIFKLELTERRFQNMISKEIV